MVIPRQGLPYAGGSLVPSPGGIPTPSPAAAPAISQKSNLERLWEAQAVSMPKPLNKDRFPHARFWERDLWQEWVTKEKEKGSFSTGVRGKGANSSFLEDEDGTRVGLARQTKILGRAYLHWRTMRDAEVDLKPYSNMPAGPLDYFRAKMESDFPELQLCADHWKADEVWQENFSSWSNTLRKPQTQKPREDARVLRESQPPSEEVSRF